MRSFMIFLTCWFVAAIYAAQPVFV